jgi:propanol-preferring alcohol dehydrogenase
LKAAVLHEVGPIEKDPLIIEDVSVPAVNRGQVRIKVEACGVCRSNLHMVEGDWVNHGVPARLPIIPGHELVGRIEAVGEGVESVRIGDSVGVQPLYSSCGRCEFCTTGRENLCQSKHITGETVDGGYAEFIIADSGHVYPVPGNLTAGEAAPLFCAGLTAYSAVKKAKLSPIKRVAVFGVGGVGHMVLQFARMYGAEVVAVSKAEQHLKLAEQLGAWRVIDSGKVDPATELKRIGGVDASIVFAPSSTLVEQAVRSTKLNGTIVIGVWCTIGEFAFPDEKRIVGTAIGSRQAMREVLRLAAAGRIKPVIDEYKLEEANQVLATLKQREVKARAVLVPK